MAGWSQPGGRRTLSPRRGPSSGAGWGAGAGCGWGCGGGGGGGGGPWGGLDWARAGPPGPAPSLSLGLEF